MEVALVDELGMDSLDAVELNMALEEEFDIEIPDEVLAGFVTVEDVVKYIESVTA
jgi:acyl carrier protein